MVSIVIGYVMVNTYFNIPSEWIDRLNTQCGLTELNNAF
jgi:hypothetical protein